MAANLKPMTSYQPSTAPGLPPRFSSAVFAQQPTLQLIYDTAPIGLAFLSPDCRYIQINQRLTEICGISVEDHLGRSVRDCVPALADAVEGIVESIMRTGDPVTGIEVAGQRADQVDERFWVTIGIPIATARVRSSASTLPRKKSPSASARKPHWRPASASSTLWRIPFRNWCGWPMRRARSTGSTITGTSTRAGRREKSTRTAGRRSSAIAGSKRWQPEWRWRRNFQCSGRTDSIARS